MKPIISPKELAAAIGVSESSLKRWADDGVIRVTRTAGGHRRIAIRDAIRFIRELGAPLVRPDLLGLSNLSAAGDLIGAGDSVSEQLLSHLKHGHAKEAIGLVVSQYLAGSNVAEIADGPIREAMTKLGTYWQHDSAGIFVEHRATDICIQAVHQLRAMIEPQLDGPVAIGGGPPGDPYLLPPILAATALAEQGWHSINLGPDTPFDTLLTAAEMHSPRIVWLSISSAGKSRKPRQDVVAFAADLSRRRIPLVVGGQGANDVAVPIGEFVHRGEKLAELIAIAGALRDAPSVDSIDAKTEGTGVVDPS